MNGNVLFDEAVTLLNVLVAPLAVNQWRQVSGPLLLVLLTATANICKMRSRLVDIALPPLLQLYAAFFILKKKRKLSISLIGLQTTKLFIHITCEMHIFSL